MRKDIVGRSKNRKQKNWNMKKVLIVTGFAVVCLSGAGGMFAEGFPAVHEHQVQASMQESIADKIIRFHVIANSDEEWDQDVKLKVRDGVLEYLQPLLRDCANRQESENVINANLDGICKRAEEILKENGVNEQVTAQLDKRYFPIKKYGEYAFPEGEYDALCIEIGEAKGKNWWCVLYPKLCFTDSLYCVTEEEGEEELKKVLTEEEYEEVLQDGDAKIVVKSRFLEWVEQLFE